MLSSVFSGSFLSYAFGALKLEELMSRYATKDRYYHNVEHIIEMLYIAEMYGIKLTDAQYLAILFHDIIYVPGAQHNEEMSIQLLQNECVNRISLDTIRAASTMVDLTRTHTISSSHMTSEVEKEFLDLDLYRLASPYEFFVRHSANIWNEYKPVLAYQYDCASPVTLHLEFLTARKHFLKSMLEKGNIFTSEKMKALNTAAIANINRYIEEI